MAQKVKEQKGFAQGFIRGVERAGNKLPDPVTLFLIIGAIILICSMIFAGVSEVNPATGETVEIVNLLSKEGSARILQSLGTNMVTFAPLASVLLIMLGMGLCERVGMLDTLVNKLMSKTPKSLVVPVVVFLGVMLNMTGDVGFLVLPPLAGMMFLAVGRHPIAGIVLAYASVAGGFSANLIINTTDVVLLGFAQSAADSISSGWVGNITFNMYFMIASTLMLIPVGMFVNNKFVEPSLGKYLGEHDMSGMGELTPEQRRGLRGSGIGAIISLVLICLLILPPEAVLRNAETGSILVNSPFVFALPGLMAFFFFACGLGYGIGAKMIKNDKNVVTLIVDSLKPSTSLLLFAFAAGNMLVWFSWSNIGPILAIKGANFLSGIGLTGLPLLLCFIVVAALINLLIASNAAKFAILAPVFVPMFILMGIDPAATTIAYRIADSITNPITPMMAYMAIMLTFCRKYRKDFGLGSLIAMTLPYTIFFAIFWTILLVIWYAFNLPIGPGFFMQFGG